MEPKVSGSHLCKCRHALLTKRSTLWGNSTNMFSCRFSRATPMVSLASFSSTKSGSSTICVTLAVLIPLSAPPSVEAAFFLLRVIQLAPSQVEEPKRGSRPSPAPGVDPIRQVSSRGPSLPASHLKSLGTFPHDPPWPNGTAPLCHWPNNFRTPTHQRRCLAPPSASGIVSGFVQVATTNAPKAEGCIAGNKDRRECEGSGWSPSPQFIVAGVLVVIPPYSLAVLRSISSSSLLLLEHHRSRR